MSGKLSVQVENFKPHRSHSLFGFVEVRLRIKEATAHRAIAALLEAFPRAFDEESAS